MPVRFVRDTCERGNCMKLKTRLVFAFCIIVILPILLFIMVFWALYATGTRLVQQNYELELDDVYGLFSGTMQVMSRYTSSDYTEILTLSQEDPATLESEEYLTEKNEELGEKSAFLIFVREGEVAFNGEEDASAASNADWLEVLPEWGLADSDGNADASYYVDGDTQLLFRQVDFYCTNGDEGSVFLIVTSESIIPEIRQMLILMILSIVLILALTAGLMTIWLYRGTMVPLKKLQVATKNISEGNLDFTIDYEEDDEMGELCRNFDEMRQRLKESTEERVSAEQENRALISNIAHDLKTPITAIKGYSEGLLDGVAATPEKQERYLRTIYNKANEMDRLINELTLYAKIDTNRIPYNFQKLNVAEYFEDCVQEIGLDLETRGIGLSYFNYAEDDILIIADPEQLMRVINNIVNNAVKYMDKRYGQLNIRIKDVGDFIQVEIEDNGKGIAARDLPYIFERFYRTDASRNSATGGSGIGLSIVKKIIEDHGGKIWATSKLGTGTIMYFVLRKYQEVPNE